MEWSLAVARVGRKVHFLLYEADPVVRHVAADGIERQVSAVGEGERGDNQVSDLRGPRTVSSTRELKLVWRKDTPSISYEAR